MSYSEIHVQFHSVLTEKHRYITWHISHLRSFDAEQSLTKCNQLFTATLKKNALLRSRLWCCKANQFICTVHFILGNLTFPFLLILFYFYFSWKRILSTLHVTIVITNKHALQLFLRCQLTWPVSDGSITAPNIRFAVGSTRS